MRGQRQAGLSLFVKRVVDTTVAAVLLLVLSPLVALVALGARLFLGSPVLFSQVRPGFRGRPFVLLKFRTMTDEVGSDGNLLPDAARLTRFGRFLRATSLDELPQLFNVLRGDLSLVGPRPLLMRYLDRYSPTEARRHEVLPGITGWAQVNGRNALSWSEKFQLDVWYVDNWSLMLDLRILARTFAAVLRRKGISRSGSATMPEFLGSEARED